MSVPTDSQLTDALLSPHAALLTPVTEAAPCGPDLEYDPQYLDLFIELMPKEKISVGGSEGKARLESAFEPVRWTKVEADCRALLTRTRDARLLVVFTRCLVQRHQWQGLLQGLALTLATLTTWPDDVHPVLMRDGQPDPWSRGNALSDLADQEGLLSEIRALPLDDGGRVRVQVRDVERALTQPHPDHVLPPEAARRMLADMLQRQCPHCVALLTALQLVTELEEIAKQSMSEEAGKALRLGPLRELLHKLAPRAESTQSHAARGEEGSTDSLGEGQSRDTDAAALETGSSAHSPAAPAVSAAFAASGPKDQAIHNREDARQRIREIRLWFEQHEPSSPVALLLGKAEALVGRRFAKVVDVLPQDLLARWDEEQQG